MQMECNRTPHHIITTAPRQEGPHASTYTHTHLVRGILVGAGIQQQPRAVRVTIESGPNQRRVSVLRAHANVPSDNNTSILLPPENMIERKTEKKTYFHTFRRGDSIRRNNT
jgi:hypothetical protein